MPRRKTKKLQPAIRSMLYTMPVAGRAYLDIAKDLSMVNRRLYDQGRQYGIESIEFHYVGVPAAIDTIFAQVFTAGNSWTVHNSFVKSKALWDEMQDLVLDDNPSVKGKWHDFKIHLDSDMAKAVHPILSPQQFGGAGGPYLPGEWNYSTWVIPQHDVDPATGLPLPALEVTAHLLGNDSVAPLATGASVGLIKAYGESRARVQLEPDVPATFSTSFFTVLTDSGSQEPELADVIEDENDKPPYAELNYPGGITNAPGPVCQDLTVASVTHPNGYLGSFVAECGLIMINMAGSLNGVAADLPAGMAVRVNLMPGDYKGVASLPMGQ